MNSVGFSLFGKELQAAGDVELDSLTKAGAGAIILNDDLVGGSDLGQSLGSATVAYANIYGRILDLKEISGIGTPGIKHVFIFVDASNDDLRVRFDDGSIVTLAVHP